MRQKYAWMEKTRLTNRYRKSTIFLKGIHDRLNKFFTTKNKDVLDDVKY